MGWYNLSTSFINNLKQAGTQLFCCQFSPTNPNIIAAVGGNQMKLFSV
jgi:hypothetical protein